MSDISLIFDITKTHLLSRFKQSIIAALGVTFGIGAFIILMGFMTGLNGLLDGLILNRTPHIHLYNEITPSEIQPVEMHPEFKGGMNVIHSIKPKESQIRIHNALPIIETLSNDPRVLGVTPQTAAKVFYLAGANELNGIVTGINVQKEISLYNFSDYIVAGDPLALERTGNGILLGAGIAEKLSLSTGGKIQVSTAGGGIFPLKVVGIFQSGLAEVDNMQSYVDINTAQRLLGGGNNFISDINIKLNNVNEAPAIAKELAKQYNLTAIDINTANAQFDTGSMIRNMITYAVSITLLIVAGFGIYNILNMFIYEKMDDIAILKATGFSGADVKKIFIGQATLIGIVGGLLGLVFGFVISMLIDNAPFETEALPTIKTYPVNYDPLFYVVGMVFAFISTFLAGYLPAQKAKEIDPVEIIRGK